MAIPPSKPSRFEAKAIQGDPAIDPASGKKALWIDPSDRSVAESQGYRVLDCGQVIASHLHVVANKYAAELLSRDMTKQLIDQLRKTHSATVDELIPTLMRLSEVQQVLKNLLREGVPIRPLHLVLETIGDHVTQIKDIDELTEKVRQRLARTLCQRLSDHRGRIRAMTLDPWIEDAFSSAEQSGRKVQASLAPSMFRSLVEQLKHYTNLLEDQARPAVLLVNPQIRPLVRQTLSDVLPRLHILSTSEISGGVQVESIGLVEMPESVSS